MAQKQKPIKEFRLGRIHFVIWANRTDQGKVWFSLEILRHYKVGNEWKTSTRYGRDDMPLVAKGTDMAHAWIWAQESLAASGHAEQEDGANETEETNEMED